MTKAAPARLTTPQMSPRKLLAIALAAALATGCVAATKPGPRLDGAPHFEKQEMSPNSFRG